MKKKVLIVEDDQSSLYMLSFLLKSHNYEVIEATDGAGGLSNARQKKPDLIFLDVQMPNMDGFEVTRALKKDKETQDIPIVILTSFAMPGDKKKAMDAGADGYIEKPINPEIFISQMELIVKSYHAGFRF